MSNSMIFTRVNKKTEQHENTSVLTLSLSSTLFITEDMTQEKLDNILENLMEQFDSLTLEIQQTAEKYI